MTARNDQPILELGGAPAIPGLRFRAFDPGADYDGLAALIRAAILNDGLDWLPSADELRVEHEHMAGFDPHLDVIVAEVDGSICAVSETSDRIRDGRAGHSVDGWVVPELRRRGLGRTLLGWAEERAAVVAAQDVEHAGRHDLESWIDVTQAGAVALLESRDYRVTRHGLHMLRDLSEPITPRELPAGLVVRPVDAADHRRIWDADVEAFRDHWNSSERTEEDFAGWYASPMLDTRLWRVAWAGDEVAGSVMPTIWTEENAALGVHRGWLEHVSVRRPWRRQGLASALIVQAMLGLRAAGMTEAGLGVDAENLTGAVHVYELLGFRRGRETVLYRREL